jgi:hypothetical protein
MEGAALVEDPTSQPDQDALNAILMTELPGDAVHELPQGENVFEPAGPEVVITDLETLSCTRGHEPVRVIQASGSPKPWTWGTLRKRRLTRCYVHLLRRALAGEGLEIRLPPELLVPWLRTGPAGALAYVTVKAWFRAPGPRRALRFAARTLGRRG